MSRRFMRIAVINACGLAVLVLVLFAVRLKEVALPSMGTSRTTSVEPVDVLLVDSADSKELRLRVPQAYLVRPHDRRGGELESITVEARLPEMSPAPASPRVEGEPGSPEYLQSLEDFNNGVVFTLMNSYRYSPEASEEVHARQLERFSRDRDSDQHVVFDLVNADFFGLRFYREVSCEDKTPENDLGLNARECRDTFSEYYLSRDTDKPSVLIICSAWDRVPLKGALGCTATTAFRGFWLTYVFRDSQMNRWVEFDDGIRELLTTFTAAAQATD